LLGPTRVAKAGGARSAVLDHLLPQRERKSTDAIRGAGMGCPAFPAFLAGAGLRNSISIATPAARKGGHDHDENSLYDFAVAWRRQPKWVVSRSLKSVGPNATLVEGDIEAVIRGLKAQLVGEIQVAGPEIARFLTDLGLIDEYRLYFRPVVLGRGKPFFAGPQPPLRLVANDRIGEDAD
jgi:hypothetical protein